MIRSIVTNVTLPLIAARDGAPGLRQALKGAAAREQLARNKLDAFQATRLRSLVEHAYKSVPFYKDRIDQSGLSLADLQNDRSALAAVPPLTKADIQDNADALMSTNFDKKTLKYSVSGGTTGRSVGLYNSTESLTQKLAVQMRFDTWSGWRPGDHIGLIWPATVDQPNAPPTWRSAVRNFLSYREVGLHQTVIDQGRFDEFAKRMKHTGATAIRGFPFQVDEIARHFSSKQLIFPPLRGVITTGEPLYPDQRKRIESACECRVFDSYRTREVGCIAQECELHNGLHIRADSVLVEIVPSDRSLGYGPLPPGEHGRILVTDLNNFAMPFIRYEIGDVGILSDRQCDCGRPWPLLEKIGGRITDLLYTPDGRKVSPVAVLPNMFHTLGIMNQFRIVQDRMDHFTILMAGNPPDPDLLVRQKAMIKEIFGPGMSYSIEYVDRIEAISSGKFPLVISEITERA